MEWKNLSIGYILLIFFAGCTLEVCILHWGPTVNVEMNSPIHPFHTLIVLCVHRQDEWESCQSISRLKRKEINHVLMAKSMGISPTLSNRSLRDLRSIEPIDYYRMNWMNWKGNGGKKCKSERDRKEWIDGCDRKKERRSKEKRSPLRGGGGM